MIVSRRTERAKRAFDVGVVLGSAPLTVPVATLCALAIRIDSRGPIIFSQQRTGLHGRPFKMLKFRTMVPDAHDLKDQLRHLNVLPEPDFKIPDDPRITRVGKFLRSTSLDELPQLWNVLRGDMSLVGPRPTSFAPGERNYHLWHTRRLEVRPGLTGRWQIETRHKSDFDERIRIDDAYIRNLSFWRDLGIIVMTVPAVLRREGA